MIQKSWDIYSRPSAGKVYRPLLRDNSCLLLLKCSETERKKECCQEFQSRQWHCKDPITLHSWCMLCPSQKPFPLAWPCLSSSLPVPARSLGSPVWVVEQPPNSGLIGSTACYLPCFWTWPRPVSEVEMLQERNTQQGSVLCASILNKADPNYIEKKVEKVFYLVLSAPRTEIQANKRMIRMNELLCAS